MSNLTSDHRNALKQVLGDNLVEREIAEAIDLSQAFAPVTVDSTAADAGNTPTSTLRQYLAAGILDSGGKALAYDPDGNDGLQQCAGVFRAAVPVSGDTPAQLIVSGQLRSADLVGIDVRGKQQLASRFHFDDTRLFDVPLLAPRAVYRKGTNYVVTAANHNALFLATAAVGFTLPTKANGLAFRFFQTANADMTITDGDSGIIVRNNAAATSVAYSTASQKIGAHCLVECMYIDTDTLAWIFTSLCNHTLTVG